MIGGFSQRAQALGQVCAVLCASEPGQCIHEIQAQQDASILSEELIEEGAESDEDDALHRQHESEQQLIVHAGAPNSAPQADVEVPAAADLSLNLQHLIFGKN